MNMSMKGLALALLVGAQAASAQPADPPAQVSGVVVQATPKTREAARRYIDRIAAPPALAISLATWRTPICVETENLRPDAAEALKQRIMTRAAMVGAPVGAAGCRPNVSLIGTANGAATASDLVRTYPAAFKAGASTQNDGAALRRFAERAAPVRWWVLAAQYDTASREFAEPLWNAPAPVRFSRGGAMFNDSLVRAMLQTVVVIDASRTQAAPVEALGDYIAMVVLAEVDPDADLGDYPTVLNLWRPGGERSRMTSWDERYLRALYCARVRMPGSGEPVRSFSQLSDIAQRMAERPDVRRGRNGKCPA